MTLKALAQFVETTITQNDYPGFEARALKIGLPESLCRSGARLFASALLHESIFVKLAALRWFQANPGIGKAHEQAVAKLTADDDYWIRLEAVSALEKLHSSDDTILLAVASRLEDPVAVVRKAAAKALGKLLSASKKDNANIIEALLNAAKDADGEVRFKAEKALRLSGYYSNIRH